MPPPLRCFVATPLAEYSVFGDAAAESEGSDPSTSRHPNALLTTYRDTCGESVKRFDGYVAQYLGDGILVFFGYSRAH